MTELLEKLKAKVLENKKIIGVVLAAATVAACLLKVCS